MTQEQTKKLVKESLENNKAWQKKALLTLYSYQTESEKEFETTEDANGRGFSYHDAALLSSFAVQLQTRGNLSDKQFAILSKKLPRYWRQIAKISDPARLQEIYITSKGNVGTLGGKIVSAC